MIKGENSIYKSWMISYALILLIIISLNAFVHIKSIAMQKQEIIDAHAASLDQLKNVVDKNLDDIKRLALEITFHTQTNNMAKYKQPIDKHYRYSMIEIIKDLKAFKIANSHIEDLYIYFSYNDFVLSSNGKYSSREFHDLYLDQYNIDYDHWILMMRDVHFNDYSLIPIKDSNAEKDIAFLHSIPIATIDKSEANIVITMKAKYMKSIIKDAKWTGRGTILIMDSTDNILASTDMIDLGGVLSYDELIDHSGMFSQKIQDEKVIISYVTSNNGMWKYISIIPTKSFLKEAQYLKMVVALSILLSLITGSYMTYKFTKRNYTPIERIMKMLKTKSIQVNSDRHKNEIDYIESSVLNLIDEKEKIYKKLDKQKLLLKNNFLSRLLRGELNQEILEEVLQNYEIEFESDYFTVMLFYMEDYSNIFFEDHIEDIDAAIEIAYFVISNVAEEVLNRSHKGYVVEIDNMVVALINNADENESLLEAAREIGTFINDNFGIILSISISDTHIGDDNIHMAYTQAAEALEYNKIMGKGQIISYSKLQESDKNFKSETNYYLMEEQKLVNAISMENYRDAEKILDKILDSIIPEITSIQMLKCRMFGLLNTIILSIEQASVNWEDNFWEELNPTQQLLECKTVLHIRERMQDILKQMDRYAKECKVNEDEKLIGDVVRMVNCNYDNENLNVSLVADRLDINPSYLSRIFKRKMGISLLDFIHNVRITNAKRIMNSQCDLTIKEVGDRVGYYNSVTFIRAFKRYEGMTPGQYKTSLD